MKFSTPPGMWLERQCANVCCVCTIARNAVSCNRIQCGEVRRRWCVDSSGLEPSDAARHSVVTHKFSLTFLAISCRHTSKILRYTFGAIRRMTTAVDKEEARKRLTPLQWHVTQEKGTERWGDTKGCEIRDNFENDSPVWYLRLARDSENVKVIFAYQWHAKIILTKLYRLLVRSNLTYPEKYKYLFIKFFFQYIYDKVRIISFNDNTQLRSVSCYCGRRDRRFPSWWRTLILW